MSEAAKTVPQDLPPQPAPAEGSGSAAPPPQGVPAEIAAPGGAAPGLAGRWQIPLLIIALLALAAGLHRIAAAYRPVTFDEEVARINLLLDAGALLRANAYVVDLLKEEQRPALERAELHRLLAVVIYRAEFPLQGHVRQNTKSILHNFELALQQGAAFSADDWVALGDTHVWSGNQAEAVAAYREALRHCPDRPDRIRRVIVELQAGTASELTPEQLADLDAILDGEPERACPDELQHRKAETSPANYLWALEYKVEWLTEQGKVAEARQLVDAAKERLAGTSELLALSYLDALCLHQERQAAEAEAALRALLNDWTAHDVLWAKANLLLGRLQQEDDRPQAALSFYEEVTRAFTHGQVYDACVLGQAECLASLEQFERSLAMFRALRDGLLGKGRHRYLDRTAVRATITALGESLLQGGRTELGLHYLELAAELIEPTATATRARYAFRIAETVNRMARVASTRQSAVSGQQLAVSGQPSEAKDLFVRAAETYLSIADLERTDEEVQVQSLELAASCFDAAGRTDREIEVLSRLVREHLGHSRRVTALYRLGHAYQAEQRYAEAAGAYDEAISSYPHVPDALRSMVPLAECLIALGGDEAKRGVDLLTTIVEDRGPEALFAPQAREYRDALVHLAEFYVRASDEESPDHLEKAIARLEETIAHYPEDAEIPRLCFLLADCYRRSGRLLGKEAEGLPSDTARDEAMREADRRVRRSLEMYAKVILALAPYDADQLSETEQTYLRTAYLYRGDCLFDLGLYPQAIEAYRETAWRYENLPASLSASTQIIHCYLRLGQTAEAKAALARLRWLLRKIPASAFEGECGMAPKEYWESRVEQMASAGLE